MTECVFVSDWVAVAVCDELSVSERDPVFDAVGSREELCDLVLLPVLVTEASIVGLRETVDVNEGVASSVGDFFVLEFDLVADVVHSVDRDSENVRDDVPDRLAVSSLLDESVKERCDVLVWVLVIILIEKVGDRVVVISPDFVVDAEYCGQIEFGIVRPLQVVRKTYPVSVAGKDA